ncbi:MAG: hypothetical protein ACREYE_10745 [Gammaproteobacteria bacterium]
MTRPTDTDRLLWLLQEQGGTSNQQIRSTLNLTDKRYGELKERLIADEFIEKYRCRGGGIRLTAKGARIDALSGNVSAVANEKALYPYFVNALAAEAKENEEVAVVFDTSALRKRGKWSNPDVTRVAIRHFPILRTHKIILSTFEIKQWGRWNAEVIYEAASQRRFAHEAYVVLEWAKDVPIEGLENLNAICGRFGVGLMTMQPHYNSFRHIIHLEAEPHNPPDDNVEEFLGYVFEKRAENETAYNSLWESINA